MVDVRLYELIAVQDRKGAFHDILSAEFRMTAHDRRTFVVEKSHLKLVKQDNVSLSDDPTPDQTRCRFGVNINTSPSGVISPPPSSPPPHPPTRTDSFHVPDGLFPPPPAPSLRPSGTAEC
ncbi:hypothetical protein GWI33_012307 [Rhynchophorus ferrugineus]|uniref:Uncharacterized protein n=1 Tax=Rhynchophorus ferrugineus TaxID=354439 RepID=A0A834IPT5_RHYFE|nr:hypothetical protein GWI33_012307 [Rhynchophorus ferrugineus]